MEGALPQEIKDIKEIKDIFAEIRKRETGQSGGARPGGLSLDVEGVSYKFTECLDLYEKLKQTIEPEPDLKNFIDSVIFASFGNYYYYRPNNLEDIIVYLSNQNNKRILTSINFGGGSSPPREGSDTLLQKKNLLINLDRAIELLDSYNKETINTIIETNNKEGIKKRVAYFYLFFMYMVQKDNGVENLNDQDGEQKITEYILKKSKTTPSDAPEFLTIDGNEINQTGITEDLPKYFYPVQFLTTIPDELKLSMITIFDLVFNLNLDEIIGKIRIDNDTKFEKIETGELSTLLKNTPQSNIEIFADPGNSTIVEYALSNLPMLQTLLN